MVCPESQGIPNYIQPQAIRSRAFTMATAMGVPPRFPRRVM